MLSAANGWINTLSDDWQSIYEENVLKDSIVYAASGQAQNRIIFAKSKNALGENYYRFIGVYKHDKDKSTPFKNTYSRISTEINLSQWLIK